MTLRTPIFILLLTTPATVTADDASAEQLDFARRRQEYLQWTLTEFGRLEPEMEALDGRAWSLNQTRLALNRQTDKASEYFESIRLTADPDFMGIRLLKTLLDDRETERLSDAAREHLTGIIRDWSMDRINGISRRAAWPPIFTENHDLMHLTIGLFSEQLRGQDPEPLLREIRKSLSWRFERGFYEWGSHRYQLHYSNPLLILAEYAPDPIIRRGADDLFQLILAERALMSVGGYLGGPGMRSYDRNRGCDYLDNNRYDSFLPTVWLALGVGEPRFDFAQSDGLEPAGAGYGNGKDPRLNQDEAMFLATSRVRPHPIVYALLEDAASRPELIYTGRRSSAGHPFQNAVPGHPRSQQVLYYYNTPHVSLGSLQYLPDAGKMSVSYNSRPRFFSVLFPENPSQVLRTRLSDADLQAGPRSYEYTADRVVQYRNWLIAAGELSASHGLRARRLGEWNLYLVGLGLCAHIEPAPGWHVFQVGDLTQYTDPLEFVNSLHIPTIEQNIARGVTTDGQRIEVQLNDMSLSVNGERRQPGLTMLHDSPLMTSVYGSGVVRVMTSRGMVTFDHSQLQPPESRLPPLSKEQHRWGNPEADGQTTQIAHVRAMGGLSPRERDSVLRSMSLQVSHNSGTRIRLAVFVGGSLEQGPAAESGSRLLCDFGVCEPGEHGWITLEAPEGGVVLPAGCPVWLAWKSADGRADVVYQEAPPARSDFQTTRGRWHSTAIAADANEPWPERWPAEDDGSFDAAWYSAFLTLEPAGTE